MHHGMVHDIDRCHGSECAKAGGQDKVGPGVCFPTAVKKREKSWIFMGVSWLFHGSL